MLVHLDPLGDVTLNEARPRIAFCLGTPVEALECVDAVALVDA
jgi:hypothetical protein